MLKLSHWPLALYCVGLLTVCDEGKTSSTKSVTASAMTARRGENGPPKALTAPKLRTGTVDLDGRCDDVYPIDAQDGGVITECTITDDLQVGEVICERDGRPQTYDDRSLRSCVVKGVLAAGELQCQQAVYFYPDGLIQTCQLTKPVRHLGKICTTRVDFNTDGAFRECR